MATPQVPPRPSRSHPPHAAAESAVPIIPARPAHRSRDRTQSPNPESFPRSPLNEIPGASNGIYGQSNKNASGSNLSLPQRPPSVSLPSIGQEGNEYGELEDHATEGATTDESVSQTEPEQKRKIGDDLPLHQPRPSFSSSNAKARVQAVTRTDSTQAAAAGIGQAPPVSAENDKDPHSRSLRPKVSFSATDSNASTERPGTGQRDDDGIPEVVGGGQRVPMYPNAGDVQAPTPSPYTASFPSGIGFYNDGSRARQSSRNRSKQEYRPPGSYGLHGHGMASSDSLEKAWYDKHPEKLETEEGGQYGPGISGSRREWALSSDDLNKIVRSTKSRGSGFGTANIEGMPNEQIGYIATEEYTSRLATPQSASYHNKAFSNHSQPVVESPLRKASFPVDQSIKPEVEKRQSAQYSSRGTSDNAVESETEDEGVHVEPPTERRSKFTGNGYDPPKEDLGPDGGNTEAGGGWVEETGYGVPILASDEVAKEPGSEYMQPAISPPQSRRGSQYYAGVDSEMPPSYQSEFKSGSRAGSAANSRPTSRPGSIHGAPATLHRPISYDDHEGLHTPLEDVDEYEPLFPDEEKNDGKSMSATERFKRKEMMKRFPSQDIWEDTPNSLQLHATVEIPEPKEAPVAAPPKSASGTFETSEQEAARKGEVGESEKAMLIPREERLAKSHFKPHLREEMQRPGMKQRFPSRDIWEDSPDSARLEAEIRDTPLEDQKSLVDEGLVAGAVVTTSGRPDSEDVVGKQERENATAGGSAMPKPSIPPRPAKTKTAAQGPNGGSMPPPSIPARPPKRTQPGAIGQSAEASPTKANEETSEIRNAPALQDRSKPEIPKRPENPIAEDATKKPADLPDAATVSSPETIPMASEDIRSPPPAPKPKPAIPARPQGSKIAALKAGFLSDLDKRLQLGPQAPQKAPEPEQASKEEIAEDKAPLSDARKGRARGPARRKPAASPGGAAASEVRSDGVRWGLSAPKVMWEIEPTGSLKVASQSAAEDTVVIRGQANSIQTEESQILAQNRKAETFRNDVSEENDLPKIASQASDTAGELESTAAMAESPPATKEAELDPPFQSSMPKSSESAEPAQAKVHIQSHDIQSDQSEDKNTASNASTQVGEQSATISPASPETDKTTAHLEGNVQKGEDVNVTG